MQALGRFNPQHTIKKYGEMAYYACQQTLTRIGNIASQVLHRPNIERHAPLPNNPVACSWKRVVQITLIFMACAGAAISMNNNPKKEESSFTIPLGPLSCVERLKTIKMTFMSCAETAPMWNYLERQGIQLTCDNQKGFSRPWVYGDEMTGKMGKELIVNAVIQDCLYNTEPFHLRRQKILKNLCKGSAEDFVKINTQFSYDLFIESAKIVNGCENWDWVVILQTFKEYQKSFISEGYAAASIKSYEKHCPVMVKWTAGKQNLSYFNGV